MGRKTSLLVAFALLYISSIRIVFGSLMWLTQHRTGGILSIDAENSFCFDSRLDNTLFDLSDANCMILSYESFFWDNSSYVTLFSKDGKKGQ